MVPDWQQEIIQSANSAVACYDSGESALALESAMRSSALRQTHWSARTAATARAWSDHAVILASLGKTAEAQEMLASCRAMLEETYGDNAEGLLIVLENAARVAFAAGNDISARENFQQLLTVAEAQGLDVSGLKLLGQLLEPGHADPDTTMGSRHAGEHDNMVELAASNAHAPEADEEPIAVEVEPVADIQEVAAAVSIDALSDLGELELVEPAPPTLDHVPEHRRHIHRDDDALGFLVQHGAAVTPDEPLSLLTAEVEVLPELALPELAQPVESERVTSVALAETPVQATESSATTDLQHAPQLVPQAATTPRSNILTPARPVTPRLEPVVPVRAEPVLKEHPRIRASGGARVWLIVGGGLAALAAAAAGFLRAS